MKVKDGVNFGDLQEVKIALWLLITHAELYCGANKLELVLTSIKGDRDNIKASSKTHSDGRAVDISVRDWTRKQIDVFVFNMNTKFKSIGAISGKSGQSVVALYHDVGYGAHINLQVRPDANYSQFLFAAGI
jgi:hypothetical protein